MEPKRTAAEAAEEFAERNGIELTADLPERAGLMEAAEAVPEGYRLRFVWEAKDSAGKTEYSEALSAVWQSPSSRAEKAVTSAAEKAAWFRRADGRRMMSETEREILDGMPEEIRIEQERTKPGRKLGISWRPSEGKETHPDGTKVRATVWREDVTALFVNGNETELIVMPDLVYDTEE